MTILKKMTTMTDSEIKAFFKPIANEVVGYRDGKGIHLDGRKMGKAVSKLNK